MTSSPATIVGTRVHFPTPPLGLAAEEFLLTPVESTRGLFTLRATDEESLRLFLLDPTEYFSEYLPRARRALAKAADSDLTDVAVLVVLNPGERGERPTANLLAPVLIDVAEGLGVQTVLDSDEWSLRAPLVD